MLLARSFAVVTPELLASTVRLDDPGPFGRHAASTIVGKVPPRNAARMLARVEAAARELISERGTLDITTEVMRFTARGPRTAVA